MSSLIKTGPKTVTRLWETACAVRTLDLSGVVQDPAPVISVDGAQCEAVPLDGLLRDPDELQAQFLDAVKSLQGYGANGGLPAITFTPSIRLTAEIWRPGHEVPQDSSPDDLIGWCFISATGPRHQDSGSVALLDPRAGSERTAMPGLPWGREFTFRPVPGLLAVAPGWLTSTVRPLEDGQTAVVVVAHVTI
ncbi:MULTISPECIES: hypothetical protein [unclassified Streptomyces]|uniref:hypothetical protein n=1 Tax=unclassified Streptomyces TaxID=2593676 RepID=UPI00382F728E